MWKWENRKSQKTRAQPHRRTRRFEDGSHPAVFAFPLSLYKVECPWGRQAHVFLMWLSPARVALHDPHLPQMLLRCHDEAYPPLLRPCQLFHLRKHLAKVLRLGRGQWKQPARAQGHTFNTQTKSCLFLLPLRKAAEKAPVRVGASVRRSGGIDCARISACSQDRGRQCPVLVVAITAKPKGSGLCQGLNKAWGFVPDIPSLVCVCVHVCSYLETDGLPADWDLKRGLAGDDNTRPGRREFFLRGGVTDLSAKTKKN